MSSAINTSSVENLIRMADDLGIKIEMAGGITTWEGQPVIRHQREVKRISASLDVSRRKGSDSGCVWYPDVIVNFPEGSFKRPDISIWCREPDEEEEAVTLIPETVIEILSRGYEKKDTEIGAPFYLSMGVKDVILFDPYTGRVEHRTRTSTQMLQSPVRIELSCGCECTV